MIGKDSINEISDSIDKMAKFSNITVKRLLFYIIWCLIFSVFIIIVLLSKFLDFQTSGNPLYLICVSLGVFMF
ncbi:hypothetical protein J2743_001796 [Methanobacterium petrolearium]|nr:hypothetical protein [Methanobacterium petrolearium]BDZ70527.1 hypothetical protein GCM10025861_10440 [Methanobacterium petrolearium]